MTANLESLSAYLAKEFGPKLQGIKLEFGELTLETNAHYISNTFCGFCAMIRNAPLCRSSTFAVLIIQVAQSGLMLFII
jgi:hypothetical protein